MNAPHIRILASLLLWVIFGGALAATWKHLPEFFPWLVGLLFTASCLRDHELAQETSDLSGAVLKLINILSPKKTLK